MSVISKDSTIGEDLHGGLRIDCSLSELPYFAYGSNMNLDQLRHRGVLPKVLGMARLPEHRIAFHGYSRVWDGGVETVVHAPGHEVWGVLYRLSVQDADVLDFWQDVREDGGGTYFHYPESVVDTSGSLQTVLLYKKDVLGEPQPPSRPYLYFIAQGAKQHGLPGPYVGAMLDQPSTLPQFEVPRMPRYSRSTVLGLGCAECGIGG